MFTWQVRPPERMALPKKLRPPLHAFIRHLLRDVLAQDTLHSVGSTPSRLRRYSPAAVFARCPTCCCMIFTGRQSKMDDRM